MKVKTLKRFTAIALSLICIVLSLPLYTSAADGDTAGSAAATLSAADVPALLDFAEAAASGHIRRLYEEETDLYTAVFENADGSKTVYTFGEPIKYVAQSGEIRDKKTALASSENGFTAADNDVVVSLPGSVSGTAAITRGGNTVTITPKDRAGITAPAVLMSDNTVRFSEPLFAANSLSYTALPSGISSDITLNRYDGEYIFAFDIGVGALTIAAAENGIYSVADVNGTPLFNFGDVVFTDSAGNYSFAELEFEPDGDGHYSLKVIADLDFLQSEDTVYPLAASVTASVIMSGNYKIRSNNLFSRSGNFVTHTNYIMVGDQNPNGETLLTYGWMQLPGLYDTNLFLAREASNIVSAKLNLYCINNNTLSMMNTELRQLAGFSDGISSYSTLMTADEANGYATAYMGTISQYNEIDITSFAYHWKNNRKYAKNGIVLSCGQVSGYGKLYASPINPTSAQRPYISVTYNSTSAPVIPNLGFDYGIPHRILNQQTHGAISLCASMLTVGIEGDTNDSNNITITYFDAPLYMSAKGHLLMFDNNKYLKRNDDGSVSAEMVGSAPTESNLWHTIKMDDDLYRIVPYNDFGKCLYLDSDSLSIGPVTYDNANDMGDRFDWCIVGTTWYSQFVATDNWNTTGLENVYFNNHGVFFKSGESSIMDEGCVITSIAMVLRNLGATMNGYDFRNISAGLHRMKADPYTVALANCALRGNEYTEVNGDGITQYWFPCSSDHSPVYTIWDRYKNSFGYKCELTFSLGNSPHSTLMNALREHPEGIVVYFKKGGNTHGVTFIGYGANSDYFRLFDPGKSSESTGKNLLFKDFSDQYGYKINDILYFVCFSKVQ